MNEQNKYYTPSIEEFHVGFEYEILDYNSTDFGKNPDKAIWNKRKLKYEDIFSGYKENSQFETVNSYLLTEDIRVKYLDKEDIESLGWEAQFPKNDLFNIRPDRANADLYQMDYDCFFREKNEGVGIEICNVNENYIIFSGKIKNKSELKKVMEMIGIK